MTRRFHTSFHVFSNVRVALPVSSVDVPAIDSIHAGSETERKLNASEKTRLSYAPPLYAPLSRSTSTSGMKLTLT
jgi:hypothetical protein